MVKKLPVSKTEQRAMASEAASVPPSPQTPEMAGASAETGPVSVAQMAAFVAQNGGMAGVGLQLTPNAITNGVLFGGGNLWVAVNRVNANGLSNAAKMLIVCINGLKEIGPGRFDISKPNLLLPTEIGGPVSLLAIRQYCAPYQAGPLANMQCPAGGNTRQNPVAAILNGGFGPSSQAQTYGIAFGKLVALTK